MEVILKDYRTLIFIFIIAFFIALVEVIIEVRKSEYWKRLSEKVWGRVVFFKDKVKTYSSSSSSSEEI